MLDVLGVRAVCTNNVAVDDDGDVDDNGDDDNGEGCGDFDRNDWKQEEEDNMGLRKFEEALGEPGALGDSTPLTILRVEHEV